MSLFDLDKAFGVSRCDLEDAPPVTPGPPADYAPYRPPQRSATNALLPAQHVVVDEAHRMASDTIRLDIAHRVESTRKPTLKEGQLAWIDGRLHVYLKARFLLVPRQCTYDRAAGFWDGYTWQPHPVGTITFHGPFGYVHTGDNIWIPAVGGLSALPHFNEPGPRPPVDEGEGLQPCADEGARYLGQAPPVNAPEPILEPAKAIAAPPSEVDPVTRQLRCPTCQRLFCEVWARPDAELPKPVCAGCLAEGR